MQCIDGMTSSTATTDGVNTVVQQIISLIEGATSDLGSASGVGTGNPLSLIVNLISVCIYSVWPLIYLKGIK